MSFEYNIISNYSEFGDIGYVFDPVGNENTSTGQHVDLVLVVLSLFICILGLVGNLVAIILIFALKNYQNSVSHWYVLQLAFTDSLFLMTLPSKVSEDLNNGFIYPEWMCKAKQTILFFNYYASILFLMIMSIDRYIAICHTLSDGLQKLRKNISASIITLFTWGISLLLCIPVTLYSYKVGTYPTCICSYEFPDEYNHTDLCIDEGFKTKHALEKCLQLSRHKSESVNGENYCMPIVVQSSSVDSSNNLLSTSNNTDFFGLHTDVYYDNAYNNYFTDDNSGEYDGYMDTLDISVLHASCHYMDKPSKWFAFIAFNFAAFLLLLIIMIICYGLIIYRPSATRMTSTSNPNTSSFTQLNTEEESYMKSKKSRSMSEKNKELVTIMCAALVASFVVCWLPFHAIHLAKVVGIITKNPQMCEVLPIIGSLLAYLNSALNPFIYIFLGANITRICKRKKEVINHELENKQLADATDLLKKIQTIHATVAVPKDDTIQSSSLGYTKI